MELRKKLGHDPGLHSKIWEEMLVFCLVEQVTALQSVLRKTWTSLFDGRRRERLGRAAVWRAKKKSEEVKIN